MTAGSRIGRTTRVGGFCAHFYVVVRDDGFEHAQISAAALSVGGVTTPPCPTPVFVTAAAHGRRDATTDPSTEPPHHPGLHDAAGARHKRTHGTASDVFPVRVTDGKTFRKAKRMSVTDSASCST